MTSIYKARTQSTFLLLHNIPTGYPSFTKMSDNTFSLNSITEKKGEYAFALKYRSLVIIVQLVRLTTE